ncbi:MAG: hypothetical protein A2925_04830 [Candidatus Yanofskybacteria bacterium RIFCSPLOWO2_01_FULL_44_22]|uniref:Resolvase/invertase-type recombinase catalytic domain-containing protein n=2 Tax=Candidatus Yanofskyibacteriota TaxID=1752733 RepID=A0A1F8GKV7_9BACT|nr:MAG: hypothetical protein UW79_C0027G0009 [Candidatus Yanofskybacteria bacterium GW2011_GWA2_44_9]OGN26024.1 MAG: hypothetical protein A2925_04830 [Candidatus Yanofskybacteria bacterium RIFCSPLOWO2_01_FULL_44_22]
MTKLKKLKNNNGNDGYDGRRIKTPTAVMPSLPTQMTKNKLNLFFAYTRVSSAKTDGNERSLSEQSRFIQEYARKNNIEILKEFREIPLSYKPKMTQFDVMLKELEDNKDIKGIILHSINTRISPYNQAKLYNLKESGYEFHFANEKLNSNSRCMMSVILIRWGISSFYVQELSRSIKKGIAYSRQKKRKC